MTQEELNELILGNFDDKTFDETAKDSENQNTENPFLKDKNDNDLDIDEKNFDVDHYRVDAEAKWPPPPPTDDHKVVYQLDDVTKGLEIKATQVFDQLESISQNSEDIQKDTKIIKNHLEKQKELFEKLSIQFPHIQTFQDSLKSCDEALKKIILINDKATDSLDCSIQAMDIMQYQDIHRQKIERVVNVMRALSKYLNSMFDTDVEDDKRVTSATYLQGDKKDDVISSDEIESLISSLGKK
ncbi:hypothetical protein CCY99_08900 [Helicobacter sp. 16-1353]|uniref:chemotaxis protein n=1 Tax=Helicobacter sp. 16-1353 TaxID=2004996 RepID=UPI000DCEFF30|nr:chemotaxis protein [Helicobacter sp. 16-1353]RAX51569.1 hypothetical protein CCY99_08900 [Helicobacter sp. 16-1353]